MPPAGGGRASPLVSASQVLDKYFQLSSQPQDPATHRIKSSKSTTNDSRQGRRGCLVWWRLLSFFSIVIVLCIYIYIYTKKFVLFLNIVKLDCISLTYNFFQRQEKMKSLYNNIFKNLYVTKIYINFYCGIMLIFRTLRFVHVY